MSTTPSDSSSAPAPRHSAALWIALIVAGGTALALAAWRILDSVTKPPPPIVATPAAPAPQPSAPAAALPVAAEIKPPAEAKPPPTKRKPPRPPPKSAGPAPPPAPAPAEQSEPAGRRGVVKEVPF